MILTTESGVITEGALRIYARLRDGATDADLLRIRSFDSTLRNVYIVQNRTASHPGLGELPWPVILLLGGYSQKHIFCTGRPPQQSGIGRACSAVANKIQWSWKLRDHPLPPYHIRVGHRQPTRPCKDTAVPFELRAIGRLLRSTIISHCQSCFSKCVGNRTFGNLAGLHRHSLRWLQLSP